MQLVEVFSIYLKTRLAGYLQDRHLLCTLARLLFHNLKESAESAICFGIGAHIRFVVLSHCIFPFFIVVFHQCLIVTIASMPLPARYRPYMGTGVSHHIFDSSRRLCVP